MKILKNYVLALGLLMVSSVFICSFIKADDDNLNLQGDSDLAEDEDSPTPKLIFRQHDNYVENDTIDIGNGLVDVLGTDGYEVPIFFNTIELLNADSITTDDLYGSATINIDNALANRPLNDSFLFRLTFGSCDFVTNWGEGKTVDENGHAIIEIDLGAKYCTISQKYNTFKISAIARGGASSNTPSSISSSGFFLQSVTYRRGAGYGTIEVNKLIQGTDLSFVRGAGKKTSNEGNIKNETKKGLEENEEKEKVEKAVREEKTEEKMGEKKDNFNYNYLTFNPNYSDEMNKAYQYAYKYGITTVGTIDKAKMNSALTRIAMAKMLSQYAINVLGKTPDTSKGTPTFNDVTSQLNSQYNNAVTLAYQLGIMGQNMKNNNFRPNDEVTRAEFATALSRILYNTSDGKGSTKYYEPHLTKLYDEGIISNTNPKLKEKRGYVMLMLMRSDN